MLTLCEEPQTSEADKTRQATAKLDRLCNSNDLFQLGANSEESKERTLKFTLDKADHGLKEVKAYFGGWHKDHKKPDGRGICFKDDGILIQNFSNGKPTLGNCLRLFYEFDEETKVVKLRKVDVGSKTNNNGSHKLRFRGTSYLSYGSILQDREYG